MPFSASEPSYFVKNDQKLSLIDVTCLTIEERLQISCLGQTMLVQPDACLVKSDQLDASAAFGKEDEESAHEFFFRTKEADEFAKTAKTKAKGSLTVIKTDLLYRA